MENTRFKVNLYTACSIKGPARRKGCCMWLLEYLTSANIPVTRQGIIKDEDTTENRITLEAINEALNRLKKPCEILINTQCENVLNSAGHCWPPIWKKSGWKNAKGKEVKNADLWEKYLELTQDHVVSFENTEHSFMQVMRSEVDKTAKQLITEAS